MEDRRSNRLCVLCYKSPSTLDNMQEDNRNRSTKFFQLLQRYLSIKCFSGENNDIGDELVTCDHCLEFCDSFCDVFLQWEKLRLDLEWRVGKVFETINCAGWDISRCNAFTQQFTRKEEDFGLKSEPTEVQRQIQNLRQEVLRGCQKKLNVSLPRVNLERSQEDGNTQNAHGKRGVVVGNSSDVESGMASLPSAATAIASQNDEFHQEITDFDGETFGKEARPKLHTKMRHPIDISSGASKNSTWRVEQETDGRITIIKNSTCNLDVVRENEPKSADTDAIVGVQQQELATFVQSESYQRRLTDTNKPNLHTKIHQLPQSRVKSGKRSRYFKTKAKLQTHNYHVHGQSQPSKKRKTKKWSASITPGVFGTRPELGVNFICPVCQTRSISEEELATHVRLIHKKILAFQCQHCSTELKTVEGCRFHMFYIHDKIFQTPDEVMGEENMKCSYIGAQKEGILNQNEHNIEWPGIRAHYSPTPEDYNDIVFMQDDIVMAAQEPNSQTKETSSQVVTLEERDPLKNWKCVICQATFNFPDELYEHTKTLHNVEPLFIYVCKPCSTQFDTSDDFIHHLVSVHQMNPGCDEDEQQQSQSDMNMGNIEIIEGSEHLNLPRHQVPAEGLNASYGCSSHVASQIQVDGAVQPPISSTPMPDSSPQVGSVEKASKSFLNSYYSARLVRKRRKASKQTPGRSVQLGSTDLRDTDFSAQ